MSQDIRSFFSKASSKSSANKDSKESSKETKKRPVVLSSDEEFIEGTPPAKEKKLQKKRRIVNNSDDENDHKTKKGKSNRESKTKNKTQVKAADIFGSEPVKRTENKPKPKQKPSNDLANVHEDEEFLKTLDQIDELEALEEKNNQVDNGTSKSSKNITPVKENKTIKNESPVKESIKIPSKVDKQKNSPEDKNTKDAVKRKSKSPGKLSVDNVKDKDVPKSSPAKKKKVDHGLEENSFTAYDDSFNDSVNSEIDPDQERFEKRRQSAALYQKFLKRSGPKNPGSKEIPTGKPGCLSGLVFVITGVLDSLERDEAAQIVKDLGGRVPSAISGKVTHLVLGEDAGPAKVAKAESMKIKIINEDELLDLIREKSGIPKIKSNVSTSSEGKNLDKKEIKLEKKENEFRKSDKINASNENKKETKSQDFQSNSGGKLKFSKLNTIKQEKRTPEKHTPEKKLVDKVSPKLSNKKHKIDTSDSKEKKKSSLKLETVVKEEKIIRTLDEHCSNINSIENMPWVDKYKPSSCKQIIGQQGSGSNCAKLMNWLSKWYTNHNGKTKLVKPSPWAKNDDGAYYKAALLSGSPGVGKTTTATLVCKELGFDTVEFNASDTRSKKLLKEQISELLSNKSLFGFVNGVDQATSKKHVLIMDEVDGMAGNEDRGGLQELINLIKNSSVPIICMCNDRNHQKMRSLVNYCFDLRFNKPRLEQIKGAMMSVCFKEGIKINPDALTEIIMGANQDIRQILNHLSMWSSNDKHISMTTATKEANSAKKDIKIGPWEVLRKIFSKEEHKKMTIHDKSDLFFQDYSLIPLFVQQNYLIVSPSCPKDEILKRVALTADSLSLGDLVEKNIRSNMAWSLLPTQAMFSSVLPGEYMSGHVAGQINFPAWLGKNSKRNKLLRMSSEVFSHIRSRTTASRSSVRLDYAKPLLESITRPLIKDGASGVPDALKTLKEYQLLREDIENLQEFNNWPGSKDPMSAVDGKVKAALTRAFNKELATFSHNTSKKKVESEENILLENGDEYTEIVESEEDNDNVENDSLIKAKKKPVKNNAQSTSRGAPRGRGKGRGK